MRLLLIALFATLLLAAPASAARFQHNGPDIDFTTGAADTVRITATGHELGDPEQLTFTRGTGGTAFTIGAGCSIQIGIVRCGVSDETRLRFTTNERADLIDASRTETPFDASVPEIFDTKGGDDVLVAGPLADEVRAGAGRDSITGGPGADSLDGGADDDVFVGPQRGRRRDRRRRRGRARPDRRGPGHDDLAQQHRRTTGRSDPARNVARHRVGDGHADRRHPQRRRRQPTRSTAATATTGSTRAAAAPTPSICGPGAADVAIVDETDSVTGCERVELPDVAGEPAGPADPVTPPAIAVVDFDRDGVVAGVDCDDTRAAIRPGARDVPGNKIDEDCTGGDARASQVGGRLSFDFTAFPNGTTRVDRLVVRELQAGGRAELRCSGRCAFRKKVGKASGGKVNLRKLIRGRLRTGATLEVRLSAPGTISRVVRFKMRKASCPSARACACRPAGRSGAVPD